MQNFSLEEEGPRNTLGGPYFEGLDKSLRVDEALEFGVIFQKFDLKLCKIFKITEKMSEKCKSFAKMLRFCVRC